LQGNMDYVNWQKKEKIEAFTKAIHSNDKLSEEKLTSELQVLQKQSDDYRKEFKRLSQKVSTRDTNDTNYVFLSFVKDYLPAGLKGLLIAIIFLAAWGSIAAALNSLAASTVVDFHQRFGKKGKAFDEYRTSKWYTLAWGVFCIVVAQFAGQVAQSLIEAVNVLGSLFYGVILGIFLVAFYLKHVKSNAIFWSAVIVETYIIISAIWPWLMNKMPALAVNIPEKLDDFLNSASNIGFLWLNAIGALGVVLLALLLQLLIPAKANS
jgi:solute:Na+ symporter, SSS family